MSGKFLFKKVFGHLFNDVFDPSTADRIPPYQGSCTLNKLFILSDLEFDRHKEGNDFIKNRMVKLKNLSVSLIKNARVERVEGINRGKPDQDFFLCWLHLLP